MNHRDFIKYGLAGAALSAATRLGIISDQARAQQPSIYDVVIVGGGLSGLTAAVAMKGRNVLVLEKEANMGGRIVSRNWEGFSYSLGASYIGKPGRDMRGYFKEIGLTSRPFPVPTPQDAIADGGEIYPDEYADQALGSLKELQDYARVGRELYKMADQGIEEAAYEVDLKELATHANLDALTVEQWLGQLDISSNVKRFINTENRGLFGSSNGDLSLLYNIPEMAYNLYDGNYRPKEFTRRPVPDFMTYRPERKSGKNGIWTFRHGMSEMVWAIEKQRELQGRLKTGAEVQSVSVNSDRTVELAYIQNGRSQKVKAYAVVLASPAPVTARIVKNGLSSQVMGALKKIKYVPYVTMGVYMKQRLFRNAWNISCLDTVFSTLNDAVRTQVDYEYSGKSVLGIAMPGSNAQDSTLVRQSKEQLFSRAMKDVERYFPGASSQVIGKYVHRFQYGFPVFAPGYTQILNTLHRDSSTKGPLFLAGDYTVYPTLGGAAASGEKAYENVLRYAETLD